MSGLYKFLVAIVENQLTKVLLSIFHPIQFYIYRGKSILHYILNEQMAIHYANTGNESPPFTFLVVMEAQSKSLQ